MQDCDLTQDTGAISMTSSPVCDPPGAAASELKDLFVLVVEDSWDVGTGLRMLLESWGADVAGPAATTADALCLVSERTPDVALVDINLRDGEQSYCLINRLHEQGVRVVVITGYADVSPAVGKVAAILQKPLRADVLLASIRPERAQ
jgi:DNA-binding NtrC family response regulator